MANVTFSSPALPKNVTVYAVAGDCKTILAVAEKHKIRIPFECRDGECGSCLIEVTPLDDSHMAIARTEKEKTLLRSLGKITREEIARAEVSGHTAEISFGVSVHRQGSRHIRRIHRPAGRRVVSDQPHEEVDVFLAYALKLEQEAALRYDQLADSMSASRNKDAEKIFRKMSKFSQMHYAVARARAGYHDLPKLKPDEFEWPGFESPETAAIWAADPLIAKDEALQIALEAERAAHVFYSEALRATSDPEVKALASEFAAEEGEHVQWMLRWIEEDKANLPHDWVDSVQFQL